MELAGISYCFSLDPQGKGKFGVLGGSLPYGRRKDGVRPARHEEASGLGDGSSLGEGENKYHILFVATGQVHLTLVANHVECAVFPRLG